MIAPLDVLACECRGHNDEVLDVTYDACGSKILTASADGTARVFNAQTGTCQSILVGHDGEISKVSLLLSLLSLCPLRWGERGMKAC